MVDLQIKIEKWAEETVAKYIEICNRLGTEAPSFYNQSPLYSIKKYPEVIIMGINPGSGGYYNGGMTPQLFLQGNTFWYDRRHWRYWQNLKSLLKKTFPLEILEDDSQRIVTNATFFATIKAHQIPWDLLKETFPYTLKLIDITHPKFILGFGKNVKDYITSQCNLFSKLADLGGLVVVGKYAELPCVLIPHPSAHLTSFQRETIRGLLALFHEYGISPTTIQESKRLIEDIRLKFKL